MHRTEAAQSFSPGRLPRDVRPHEPGTTPAQQRHGEEAVGAAPGVYDPPLAEYDDDFEDGPRIHFSGTEVLHLVASISVLTVAFAFALGQTNLLSGPILWSRVVHILPYSALIVVTSFMLHEFAHKVAAQLRHMWAEFRASAAGLVFALAASIGAGIVLAAPGAVMIYGHATRRDSGVISIVGPWVNLVLGFLALPFTFTTQRLLPLYEDGWDLFQVVVFVNAFLAAFNMLPISPLDGSKVWKWSKLAYLGTVAAIVVLFALLFLGTPLFGPSTSCVGQAC